MKIFRDDEAGYRNWIDMNPNGFVVNSYKKPKAEYLVLHKADCGSISSEKIDNYTTKGYIKICANDLDELTSWAKEHVNGRLRSCQMCKP